MSTDELRDSQSAILDQLMQLGKGQATLSQQIADLKEQVNSLQGDGGNDKPGIRIEVDRLKSQVRLMLWPVVIALTAAIGMAVQGVWSWIKGGKP